MILHGESPEIRSIRMELERIARSNASVLLVGETGVGKEIAAHEIHCASKRARGPFVQVNLAAIPESLMEAELFGHEMGAFTGASRARAGRIEAAHTGTLFLDEIGELPLTTQVKLLRVLQNGEFERLGSSTKRKSDFRLFCATHRDLDAMVAEGKFREDL